MSKTNALGVTFTISLLTTLLVYCVWRIFRLERELVKCYSDQTKDVVHLDTASD